MTRDDIIRMAREAGWSGIYSKPLMSIAMQEDDFLRFAALVAAAEREACIRIIEEHQIPVGNSPAGEMACELTYDALKEIRAAIRARSEQEQPR